MAGTSGTRAASSPKVPRAVHETDAPTLPELPSRVTRAWVLEWKNAFVGAYWKIPLD